MPAACVICKAKIVWWNCVDPTNGSYDNNGKRIDGYIELKVAKKAKECKCKECGVVHVGAPVTYKLPKKGGHRV